MSFYVETPYMAPLQRWLHYTIAEYINRGLKPSVAECRDGVNVDVFCRGSRFWHITIFRVISNVVRNPLTLDRFLVVLGMTEWYDTSFLLKQESTY